MELLTDLLTTDEISHLLGEAVQEICAKVFKASPDLKTIRRFWAFGCEHVGDNEGSYGIAITISEPMLNDEHPYNHQQVGSFILDPNSMRHTNGTRKLLLYAPGRGAGFLWGASTLEEALKMTEAMLLSSENLEGRCLEYHPNRPGRVPFMPLAGLCTACRR